MTGKDSEQKYIERIRSMCVELYRCAHIVTGSGDIAEQVLKNAVVSVYTDRSNWQGRMTLQDAAYEETLEGALASVRSGGYEMDPENALMNSCFDRLPEPAGDLAQQLLFSRVMREKFLIRRMLIMRYGLDMSRGQIAQSLHMRKVDVQEQLRLCQIRLMKSLKKSQIDQPGGLERGLSELSKAALRRLDDDVPEIVSIFQYFDERVELPSKSKRPLARVLRVLLGILAALLCAFLVWLIAILLEPREIVRPADSTDVRQELKANPASSDENEKYRFFMKNTLNDNETMRYTC